MHTAFIPRIRFHAAFLAGLVLVAPTVMAASQCKGVSQDACAASAECTWVEGYTRKDGRTVSSHCKLRSGKKAAKAAESGSPKLGSAQ
jgi:hypothetical protein